MPAGAMILLAWSAGGHAPTVWAVMAVIAVVSTAICIGLGRFAEIEFGKKDPGACTIDEFAGQATTFLFLPMSGGLISGDWLRWSAVAAIGFLAFRAMDILKPPPARQLEKLPRGWGVALDDLAAGVYANLICQLVVRLALGMS